MLFFMDAPFLIIPMICISFFPIQVLLVTARNGSAGWRGKLSLTLPEPVAEF
jgi:hypothetical protein